VPSRVAFEAVPLAAASQQFKGLQDQASAV